MVLCAAQPRPDDLAPPPPTGEDAPLVVRPPFSTPRVRAAPPCSALPSYQLLRHRGGLAVAGAALLCSPPSPLYLPGLAHWQPLRPAPKGYKWRRIRRIRLRRGPLLEI